MDRNLGALDDKYHELAAIKSKYYQFGRKDPFNSDIYCWTYDSETLTPSKTATANGMTTIIKRSDIDNSEGDYKTGGHNVPFSVNNPLMLISAYGYWSSTTDIFGGTQLEDKKTTKYWNDPRPFIRIENEETSINIENKSFFDPCPPRWRIPYTQKCWKGFMGDSSGSATADVHMNCQWGVDSGFKDRGAGATYFPLGYLSQKGNPNAQTIFFPASSNRSSDTGKMNYPGKYTKLWATSSSWADAAYCLSTSSSSGTSGESHYQRTAGLSVRCIKE